MARFSKGVLLTLGALACGQLVQAETPCGSCGTCCPRVIKVKKNIGLGAGDPPRVVVPVSSIPAITLSNVNSVRFAMPVEEPATLSSRDAALLRELINSRDVTTRVSSTCSGSSDDIRDLKSKIDKLADNTEELRKVVGTLANRVVAVEKEVVKRPAP